MTQKLLSEVEDALADNDFSDEEIDRFEMRLRALPEERVLGALAIPHELKNDASPLNALFWCGYL